MTLPADELWSAFEDGRCFRHEGRPILMRCVDGGSLIVPTGRIVACDPIGDPYAEPLPRRVPPGDYPVFLSVADMAVALVMIQFAPGRPIRWASEEPTCFSVDSGTGCLMDAKAQRRLQRRLEEDHWERTWRPVEQQLGEKHWANICLHEPTGANVIAFDTFGGDGTFATYWGLNNRGKPVCVIVDMFLELLDDVDRD